MTPSGACGWRILIRNFLRHGTPIHPLMKKLLLGLVFGSSLLPVDAAVLTFSNPASISMNEPATVHTAPTVAVPYPSTIAVSGVTDPVSTIRVTLNNINQPRPDDMEILLVSPGGVKFVILSDAGGAATPAVGVNLTLGDSGATQVPDAGPLTTGTFQPTCVDSANNIDTGFPAPAPAGPYIKPAPRGAATFASAFAGINVNGTWSLFAVDDSLNSPQTASITGGWTIEITTTVTQVPSVTTLSSTPNPSFTTAPSNAVTFTATVTKQSDGTPVTVGTVTFKEGATILAANVALNGSGQAAFNTSSLAEGSHAIAATYNESAMFLTSTGNTTQTVDNHTVVMGNTFCNTGVITFADAIAPGGANVYPSRIFVSGLAGTIKKVTAQIKTLNHARPDDIDLLLVSPNGTKFILMSDAGGTTAASGATLTFDDAAASTLPDSGAVVTGTYRPSSFTGPDSFPAPAPAGPYLTPESEGADKLTAFNGVSPNGTWTLYVVDDIQNTGQVNTITNGWCLTFALNLAPTLTNVPKSGNEDMTVAFSAADFDAHFTDADAGDTLQILRITSLPANGTLKLGAAMISTVPTDIPRANIGTLTFEPTLNFNGATSFGWNGSDGAAFAASAASVNITVNPLNDSPVLAGIEAGALPFTENSAALAISATIGASDIDSTNLVGATVAITANYANGQDVLAFTNQLGITGSFTAATGVLTLTGTTTLANYQSALRAVTYRNTSDNPSAAARTVTFQGNDGGAVSNLSNTVARTINITAVNDAPVITGQNAISTAYNNSRAIALADLLVTDVDNTYPTGFTLGVQNGTNYTRVGNTITPAVNFFGTLSVPAQVNDGAANSNTFNLAVTVNPDPAFVKVASSFAPEPGGGNRISFIGNPGQTYTIQFTPSLAPVNWQFLATRAADATGHYSLVDIPPVGTPMRFYRSFFP